MAMATDVAAFAKQLKEEGIEAAKREAETIISEAKAKAGRIIAEANGAAQKMKEDAAAEISRDRQRSEAELRLAARDQILGVKQQIERVASALLKEKVAQALSTEEVVKSALLELVRSQKTGREWELSLGPTVGKPLAQAVVDELFKTDGAKVKLAEGLKRAGFELKTHAGTEVIDVSDESVTEVFRRLLSPELQKILDAELAADK
jgi:V/A-type H+-transporting ATPase subunit E